MIIIKNVYKTFIKKGYFYFTALGDVNILFKCKSYYRFFNLNITSSQFDLQDLKNQALIQLINNLFDINNCFLVKRYINNLSNILNINVNNDKIEIKQNKYFLPYSLSYKVKNILKIVKVNQNK